MSSRQHHSVTSPTAAPQRVGLIGAGGFGAYHLRFLKIAEEKGLCRLVAVADPSGEKLAEVRAQLEQAGVHWHGDYLEMLARERLDLVVIATPIPLHTEMTLETLARTHAAIYLEKPPAPTLGQLRDLIDADSGQRVHVGFQMVTWKAFRQLKSWICEGRLGRVQHINSGGLWPRGSAYYQRAGWAGQLFTNCGRPVFDGPATNALAHLVHGTMFLAGAKSGSMAQPELVSGEFYRARPIPSYDAACLSGKFASGIEYTIAVAHCTREERPFEVRVEGTQGRARILANGKRLEADFADPQEFDDPYDATMHIETLSRLRDGLPPLISLRDCLGYSIATCGGLASSGGIHDFPAECVTVVEPEEGGVCHVAGLAEAFAVSLETGLPWSQQELPWAQAQPEALRPTEVPPELEQALQGSSSPMFSPATELRNAIVL